MKSKSRTAFAAIAAMALAFTAAPAFATGELQLFNWGDYTSKEMIKKFEEKYDVKVTISDFDSNDTALAKVRAGGHGFDVVVPSANYVPIWISEECASGVNFTAWSETATRVELLLFDEDTSERPAQRFAMQKLGTQGVWSL